MSPKVKSTIFFLLFTCPFFLSGQELTGTVVDETGVTLPGANVYWETIPEKGTVTDEMGEFLLPVPEDSTQRTLIVRYVGYQPDTIYVRYIGRLFIQLQQGQELETVEVSGRRSGSFLSQRTNKIEVITAEELTRSACCDLAGCFETQGTVQPVTTNVVLNSRELRIMGLSGVYTQVLVDGMPQIQGLSYTYGISSFPGFLIDNIFVAKGATSVLQGFEGISGQINVVFKEAETADRFFFNAYMNSFWEKQLNASYAYQLGKNWSGMTAAHGVLPAGRFDRDKDNFMDLPLLSRQVLYQQFRFGEEDQPGFSAHVGLRLWHEQRTGGQMDFERADRGSTQVFGQTVEILQPELYSDLRYRFSDKQSIVLQTSGFFQDQQSWFGTTNFQANQTNAYANLQYERKYGKGHDIKAGLSYRFLDLNENIGFSENLLDRTFAGDYFRDDRIVGLFAEHAFRWEKITVLAGVRADHHQQFGWFFTPRTHLKWQALPNTTLRASVGTGFRTANVFSENIQILSSSRNIVFEGQLNPEEAVSMGLSLAQAFYGNRWSLSFSTDLYHTRFQNQIFPDYDVLAATAVIRNFTGESASNSFQADMRFGWDQILEFKLAYNYLDVYRMLGEEKVQLPFNPRHRVMSALSYEPRSSKWQADLNVHWYGAQRLPLTTDYPAAFQQPDFSDPYTVVNLQLTRRLKQLEVYAGCENIFDFRQLRPIVSWQDPFGPYFDTAFTWGPTRGREVYLGVRYRY